MTDRELLRKMANKDDFSWIAVKAWDDEAAKNDWVLDQSEVYNRLMEHHLNEVEFLRSTIAKLAQELLAVRD